MNLRTRIGGAAKVAVVSVVCLIAFAVPAHAAAIIDFSSALGLAGGTINVDAYGNVVGSGIGIDLLTVSGAPLKNGTYDVGKGVLSFDTKSGTIEIDGSVAALGIGVQMSTWLLKGSISEFDFDAGLLGLLGVFGATGPDSKNPVLLNALGLPKDTPFQYFGFSIGFDPTPFNDKHTYNVVSADIVNTQVPEPSTLALLGTGLFGLAGAARRRLRGSN